MTNSISQAIANIANLKSMSSMPFFQRALIVGILVSLCAALLGVSLVLKRYSMIGDGLSHVAFGALAIAYAANIAPLYIAIPIVILAAFLLLKINDSSKIKGDAAIAVVSSGALAIGVMIVSLTTGMNTDVCNYMFGSINALTNSDLILSITLSVAVIILYVIFYHRIFAVTFDENFAKATGSRAGVYNTVLAVLTAVTVVVGMRMMGALLISSLIIFPSLSAMRVCKRFKTVVITSAIISVVCFVIGFLASCVASIPTGASIVCMDIIAFLIFFLIRVIRGGVKN